MNKLAATFLALLVFSCFGFAQKGDKPKITVIWGADPNCHPGNSEEVKALKPLCSAVEVDTLTFYIVSYGGVSYAMSHRPVRDYLVASVQISNKTESPLQLQPNRSRLGRYKSAEEYVANAKGEFTSASSQDQLRRASYRESTVIGEREGGIRSGLQVQQKYEEIRARDGRVISRTTRLEPAAPQTSAPTPSLITNQLLIPKAVFDNVLKSKMLAAGEKAAGHLVFKHADEEKGYLVLFLNAGQIEFVFPVVKK